MLRRALRVLEFEKVLEHAAGFASTSGGKEAVRTLVPATDPAVVRVRLAATAEVVDFLATRPDWFFPELPNPAPSLERLAVEGSVLDPGELYRLSALLAAGRVLARSLATEPRGQFPALDALAANLTEEPALQAALGRAVDREGRVLDSASRELARIRNSLAGAHNRVVAHVESILAGVREAHRVPGASITIREGRYVIPIRREGKRALGGYVHDESATGATVYVEPPSAISMMNRIRELQRAEAREVQRVLRELTERCRAVAAPMTRSFHALVEIDQRVALARAARSWDGSAPEVAEWPKAGDPPTSGRPLLAIRAGRHPLLVAAGANPVPFDVELDPDEGVVVVTGPNAGGKTVFLKSVGLASALAQSGAIPPVGPGTRLPVFDSFFADVGDQQSIADSLSTFSAHLRNLKETLEGAGPRSLVLVDEPGTGTDPKEGEALGRALVETLADLGCTAVVTSHLGALKRLAAPGNRIVNASLEFDADRLMPTYRFVKGRPGRSYGLSIARGLGFPTHVVDLAERYRDRAEARLDDLLASLEEKEREAIRLADEAERERAAGGRAQDQDGEQDGRAPGTGAGSRREVEGGGAEDVARGPARGRGGDRQAGGAGSGGSALEEAARSARRRVEEARPAPGRVRPPRQGQGGTGPTPGRARSGRRPASAGSWRPGPPRWVRRHGRSGRTGERAGRSRCGRGPNEGRPPVAVGGRELIPDTVVEKCGPGPTSSGSSASSCSSRRPARSSRDSVPSRTSARRRSNVVPAKGFFKDFSSGESGDVFHFLMKHQGMSFVDAVKYVGARSGVDVRETRGRRPDDLLRPYRESSPSPTPSSRSASGSGRAAQEPREYLKGRALSARPPRSSASATHRDEWRTFCDVAAVHGLDENIITETGFVKISDKHDKPYDAFRDRITFPIESEAGRVLGFGGRLVGALTGRGLPKYLNSPESPLFRKGEVLYGIGRAKNHLRREGASLLVEGYMDVVSLAAVGIRNAVAPLGTALTEQQADILSRYAKEVPTDLRQRPRRVARHLPGRGHPAEPGAASVGGPPFPRARIRTRLPAPGARRRSGGSCASPWMCWTARSASWRSGDWFSSIEKTRNALDRLLPTLRAVRDPQLRDIYLARVAERTEVRRETLEAELQPSRRLAEARLARTPRRPAPKVHGRGPERTLLTPPPSRPEVGRARVRENRPGGLGGSYLACHLRDAIGRSGVAVAARGGRSGGGSTVRGAHGR